MSNWLLFNPTSGQQDGSVTITASTITEERDRSGELRFYNNVYDLTGITQINQYYLCCTAITITNVSWVNDIPASGGTATSANCSYSVIAYYNIGTTEDITNIATVSGSLEVGADYTTPERHSVGTLTLTASFVNERGETLYSSAYVNAYQQLQLSEINYLDLYGLMWITDVPWSGGTASSANCAFDVDFILKNSERVDISNYATVSGSLTLGVTEEELRETAGTLTLTAQYSGFSDSENVVVWQQGLLCAVTLDNIYYIGEMIPYTGGTVSPNDFTYTVTAHYWDGRTKDVTSAATISGDFVVPLDDKEDASTAEFEYFPIELTATYKGFSDTGELFVKQEVSPYRRYLKIIARESGNLTMSVYGSDGTSPNDNTIEFSTDNGSTWNYFSGSPYLPYTVTVNIGDEVLLRGLRAYSTPLHDWDFNTDFAFDLSGNCHSLINRNKPNRKYVDVLSTGNDEGGLSFIFRETKVVDASKVLFTPITEIRQAGGTDLPQTLSMRGMFLNCSGMTKPPQLIVLNTLEKGNYKRLDGMFSGCTFSATPEMYVDYAYSGGIATEYMFADCTNLTEINIINTASTIVSESAMTGMYKNCTSLITPPALPATTLANECYLNMFSGCTALTSIPNLPATQLGYYCYSYMFAACNSLTSVDLRNVKIDGEGYGMFAGCNSLQSAYLNSEWAQSSYMFFGCSGLSYINYPATKTGTNKNIATNWVNGVASTGTFVENPQEFGCTWSVGNNGIPSNWVVTAETISSITIDNLIWVTDIPATGGIASSANCSFNVIVHFIDGTTGDATTYATVTGSSIISQTSADTRHSAGTLTLTATYYGLSSSESTTVYQKGYDLSEYFTIEFIESGTVVFQSTSSSYTRTIEYSINNGAWISITSRPATTISADTGDIIRFRGNNSTYNFNKIIPYSNNVKIYGNIMSLIDSSNFATLKSFTEDSVFDSLFRPDYPSYSSGSVMDVSGLLLPATALTEWCYHSMFAKSNIEEAPVLPAKTLVPYCYYGMFYDCTKLKYIKCLATDISASNCTNSWIEHVPKYIGTFVKDANMTSWTTGWNDTKGIPYEWTVEDA